MSGLDDVAAIAAAEYAALPDKIRALTGDLEIRVADVPSAEVMQTMGLSHPHDLLGLFEGLGLAEGGANVTTGTLPNRVWLYREPILAFVAEGDDTLQAVVRHVLIHEIGHHFGLSDDDMYAIDDTDD